MSPSELSRIERSVTIRAPRSRVWRALTDINEFAQWFGVKTEGSFAPGVRVEMTPQLHGCSEPFVVYVDRMEPEGYFSWRWQPGAYDPKADYYREPLTLVEFFLEEANGGTLLKVVESGFDLLTLARRAKVFEENRSGWEYELNSILKHVEGTN